MKKRILSLLCIIVMLLPMLLSCDNLNESESTTPKQEEETTTQPSKPAPGPMVAKGQYISVEEVETVIVYYHGQEYLRLTDQKSISEILELISKVEGTIAETTTLGLYGIPYSIKICFRDENKPYYLFNIWKKDLCSTNEYKDEYGYEFLFDGADCSGLWQYLEDLLGQLTLE